MTFNSFKIADLLHLLFIIKYKMRYLSIKAFTCFHIKDLEQQF